MEVKAFPGTPTFDQNANRTVWQEGMDLRDYFAAKALLGLITNCEDDFDDELLSRSDYPAYCMTFASSAYNMADAMMEARNGNKE